MMRALPHPPSPGVNRLEYNPSILLGVPQARPCLSLTSGPLPYFVSTKPPMLASLVLGVYVQQGVTSSYTGPWLSSGLPPFCKLYFILPITHCSLHLLLSQRSVHKH